MSFCKATKPIYIFCSKCGQKAWINQDHELHTDSSSVDHVNIDGIFLIENFISPEEEDRLVPVIDKIQPWVPSQEGRAKQDYGPRVSFLKQKVSVGNFNGFPDFANLMFQRMKTQFPSIFLEFRPVEFCILEYRPDRGSYIRPHYDDKWVWGDRLITINLLSETILRLTREFNIPPYEIVIKMPPRSLLVIHGEARHDWHHSINKYDIKSRRIAMTWREFSKEILGDENHRAFVTDVLAISSSREIVSDYDC